MKKWLFASLLAFSTVNLLCACAIAASLIAQAAQPDKPIDVPGGWFDVGSLSVTGLLGWYMWYNASSFVPKLLEKHAESQAAQSAKFCDTIDSMSVRQSESIREVTKDYRDGIKAEQERYERLMDAQAIKHQQSEQKFLESLKQVGEQFRCSAHQQNPNP